MIVTTQELINNLSLRAQDLIFSVAGEIPRISPEQPTSKNGLNTSNIKQWESCC